MNVLESETSMISPMQTDPHLAPRTPRVSRTVFWIAVLSGALAFGCAPAGETPAASTTQSLPLDLSGLEVVDLSHSYGGQTLYWPTDTQGFRHDELAFGPTDGGYFYSAYSFCTAEHGGTHLDAPIHFFEGGLTMEEIPFDSLLAPAVVIDVTSQSAGNADYLLQVDDIEDWETQHGTIPTGSAILLRTGWSRKWPDARQYLGDDTPGDASNLHFPSYGEEAARLLVYDRGAKLLGVDTASIDYGPSEDFIVHQVAAAAGVPGLENLTALERLPETGAWLIALPMKIESGSGGPARAVALLPRS